MMSLLDENTSPLAPLLQGEGELFQGDCAAN